MPYSSELSASIVRVAGEIAVEYIRQHRLLVGGEELPMQLDAVIECFEKTYGALLNVVPPDEEEPF